MGNYLPKLLNDIDPIKKLGHQALARLAQVSNKRAIVAILLKMVPFFTGRSLVGLREEEKEYIVSY